MRDGRSTARTHHQGRVRGVVAGVAALALVLAGCGDTSDPVASDGAATTAPGQATDDTATTTPAPDQAGTTDSTEDDMDPSKTPIPAPGSAPLPTGPVPDAVVQNDDVQEAIAAEADRLGVDPEDVEVVGYATVTWSDGSLGCPKPGMMYTQALVPGRQLILKVDGQQASYHAAAQGSFSYCARPTAPTTGTATSTM